jgi:two-component system cell cycle response regulator
VARHERPDLIVCDVQLPKRSGYDVARQLKGDPALAAVPLLAVTAFAMVGDRDKILTAGFDGYLPKPIDPQTFVAQVLAFLKSPSGSTPPPSGQVTGAPPPAVAGPRILVVDNQPVNLLLKQSLLGPLGYVVVTAAGMAEGLTLARRSPPDLIISDIGMSDGSGYDFIQLVKADPNLRAIPFLFITSTHCDEKTRARGLALGADRVLFRPLEPQSLLVEIEACLGPRQDL